MTEGKKNQSTSPSRSFSMLASSLCLTSVLDFQILRFSAQFSSVAQSCLTLCDPMDCSTPDFPVPLCLPEFAQTHVHRVSDAIQSSHSLSSSSAPALGLSQHQGLS